MSRDTQSPCPLSSFQEGVKFIGLTMLATSLLALSRQPEAKTAQSLKTGLHQFANVTVQHSQPLAVQPVAVQPVPQTRRLEISLSHRQVTLYEGTNLIKRFRIGIGRPGWETPQGTFQVSQMMENPTWISPFNGQVIAGGAANNPLGRYWVGFWTDGHYWVGFHGTLDPNSVGQARSHGCLHMYSQDLQELYSLVSLGTQVTVMQ